jgi:hypothetical protein
MKINMDAYVYLWLCMDYIKQYMGAPTGVDVEALRR